MTRAKRMFHIRRLGKRAGFSLTLVLIISIVAISFTAVAMRMMVLSAGSARVDISVNTRYNLLQNAVQEGMAILKRETDTNEMPPTYDRTINPITEVDQLLINYDFGNTVPGVAIERTLTSADLRSFNMAGNDGLLVVKIYDMQYPAGNILLDDPAEISMLPLSRESFGARPPASRPTPVNLDGSWGGHVYYRQGSAPANNAGVYLIRASLAVDGHQGRTMLEAAVIQANNTSR